MSEGFLFTSESVTEGHPDKVADQISDAIVDAALAADPHSRVAVETLLTTGLIVLAGEITTTAVIDFPALARQVVCEIGYDTGEFGFDGNAVGVITALDRQSPDIARGVTSSHDQRSGSTDPFDAAGAGDQGMMFGYASNETPELMPMPIVLAHGLARRLAEVRRNGLLPYLRPDGKTQVTVRYDAAGRPAGIEKVLISTQHEDGVEAKLPDALWEQVVTQVLPGELYDPGTLRREFYVNPTGRFVIGGPVGDTGLTGRKIIVDTYGGFARHGGGAFSGKDPSKVDRSASYAARHVAKNIVAAGLADRAEVQVAYAIGVARPMSLLIETFGTEKVPRPLIADLVRDHFDLRPAALVQALDLRRPIYRPTAAYGHFGRDEPGFTWERTDQAAALRTAAHLDLSERTPLRAAAAGCSPVGRQRPGFRVRAGPVLHTSPAGPISAVDPTSAVDRGSPVCHLTWRSLAACPVAAGTGAWVGRECTPRRPGCPAARPGCPARPSRHIFAVDPASAVVCGTWGCPDRPRKTNQPRKFPYGGIGGPSAVPAGWPAVPARRTGRVRSEELPGTPLPGTPLPRTPGQPAPVMLFSLVAGLRNRPGVFGRRVIVQRERPWESPH